MKKEIEKKRWLIVSAIILSIGIICMSGWFYHYMDFQMEKERDYQFCEISMQIVDNLNTVMENEWNTVNIVQKSFEGYTYESMQQFENWMERISVVTGVKQQKEVQILALDQDGNFYSSDGEKGKWNDYDQINQKTGERCSMVSSSIPGSQNDLVLIRKLSKQIKIGETETIITHVGIVKNMESIQNLFQCSFYQMKNIIFIANREKQIIYFDKNQSGLNETDYIGKKLEDISALNKEKQDDMEEEAREKKISCDVIDSPNGECNFAVASMPQYGWMVYIMVPTQYVAVSTVNMVAAIIKCLLVIGLLLVTFLVLFVIIMVQSGNDRISMEKERESNQILEEKNLELKKAREEADDANQAKSRFLSRMSHDIRTPLNGIIGMQQVAMKNEDDPKRVKECLEKIRISSSHLLDLINDLLDYQKLDEKQVHLDLKPFDLNKVLDDCISMTQIQLSGRTLETDRKRIRHSCLIGNELCLRRILLNILGNAIKYTDQNGEICFRAEEYEWNDKKAEIRFCIEDNGIGMSKEYQQKIFDPFTQEKEEEANSHQGSGLGMAIVKKYIELMGGSIEVESQKNIGSCFTIWLSFDIVKEEQNQKQKKEERPKDMDWQDEKKQLEPNNNQQVQKESILKKKVKILLVEDNELNREVICLMLEGEPVEITMAEDGKKAEEMFLSSAEGTFDLIFMDILMPVMNGLKATEIIRNSSHPQAKTIPIIAMTANAFEDDVKASLKAGMNTHLTKPIEMEDLFRIIQKYGR